MKGKTDEAKEKILINDIRLTLHSSNHIISIQLVKDVVK